MYRNSYGSEGLVVNTQQGDRSMARSGKSSKTSNYMLREEEEMDAELWYACAGPQHVLPSINSLVAYFPQGHIEQVASFNNPDVEGHIPRYDLPAAIPCTLNDIRLSADPDTDEVFATVTLCPVSDPTQEPSYSLESPPSPKRKSVFFTKTLTVSDTSTHGGFSVPRKGAEDCFPPLDKTQDNPIQDLVAKDLHGNEWKFRHLFRGQPKRHLLTTGWSVFVSQKRLVAGDAVLFLRGEDGQLRIAVRLAPRQQKQQSIMVTTPTMAIGVLEAAAHAASENSRFSLIYNPRSCPSQFVIPYSKYANAMKNNFSPGQRVKSEFPVGDTKSLTSAKSNSVGNRNRTRFESDDSSDSRLLGTITEITENDHARWPGSVWRSIQVKWDESCNERQERVSPWEITAFSQRVSQPVSYGPKRRQPRSLPPLQTQLAPSMGMNSGNYGKHERVPPPPAFAVNGIQDFLGYRNMDVGQGETTGLGMHIYETYKSRCEMKAMQPCSPRPATLHTFVKPEPFGGDADLQLRVSSVAEEQASSKGSTSAQASLGQLREWLPSPRPYPVDERVARPASRPDYTALSMSNLPPSDSGSSDSPAVPKPGFWAKQSQPAAPAHVEHSCRIFGVQLDRPATPPECREAANGQQERTYHDSRTVDKCGSGNFGSSSSGLASRDSSWSRWSRPNEVDW